MDTALQTLTGFIKGLTRPYPGRDWLIIISVSGLVSLAGIGLAIYVFLGVQTGSIVSGTTQVPRAPIPVSREAIKTVLDTYQAKANNYASKTFPPVDVVDPRSKRK